MNGLRYKIEHSGLNNDNDSDYEYAHYYERSCMFGIIAQCMDTHDGSGWKGYKTIRFFHDYEDNDIEMEKLIKEELRKRFAKKFRYCDSCEEEILDQIERDYA